jgi:serine/threonine protein kinase
MHPRVFGKFRIVKLLPLGGMGRVYLANDPETGQNVALKLIDQGPDPERREIVEAERRGAILQSRLCGIDDRITRIRSYGDDDGFFYIEMEYVEGQDLAEVIAEAPLGVPFAARIGRDLCEVLHHAHTFSADIEEHRYHGIVHGDIKPRNIRIRPDGQIKVLDFGIAKALSLTRQFTTNQFASSQYSSPERLHTGDVDIASDLWSVGVVLYEIVTGKPYFDGGSSGKLEHAIRNYSAVRPLPESLPAPFRAILRKALAPSPANRYQTAQAFASDLNAFLQGKSTVAETVPLEEDPELTRRTSGPVNGEIDEEATRRSPAPGSAPISPQPPPGAKPYVRPVRVSLTPRQRRIRFFGALGVLLFAGLLIANEVTVWRAGDRLANEIQSERLTDMEVAWTRYEALSKSSVVPVLLSAPRNTIKSRLISAADRVINEYRMSDTPTVRESDWIRAHDALAKALEIDPGDKSVRGKFYLTEGHLARINGAARRDTKLLQDARARFEQAAELTRAPDPYLGLGRLYIYSLSDVERAEAAFKAAGKRGYEKGRREREQLADGYRYRGERLMREANKASGLPEETDLLERSEKDLQRAEDLYREILPYGNSGASLRRVLENLEVVGDRIDDKKGSIWPWR